MTDEPESTPEPEFDEPELAHRLCAERPLPGAGFRGALRRDLAAHDPGYGPRPAQLRLSAAGYVGAGWLLIALGTLVAVGVL